MNHIKAKEIKIILFEPALYEDVYNHSIVIKDIEKFKIFFDIIVANMVSNEIQDVVVKFYTIDLFIKNCMIKRRINLYEPIRKN